MFIDILNRIRPSETFSDGLFLLTEVKRIAFQTAFTASKRRRIINAFTPFPTFAKDTSWHF